MARYRFSSYIDAGMRELVRHQIAGTGASRRRGQPARQRASEVPPPPPMVPQVITVKAGRRKLRRLRKRGWVPVDQIPGPPLPPPLDPVLEARATRVRADVAARRRARRYELHDDEEPF